MKSRLPKLDIYLILIFGLILLVFKAPSYSFLCAIPVLVISYYKILIKSDFTTVIILMVSARLIMGPTVPNNDLSFDILNLLCNYIPITIFLGLNSANKKVISAKKLFSLKWTILLVIFLLVYGLLKVTFLISVFAQEVLPLILFLLVVLTNTELRIDYHYLLRFFRYAFLACLFIYVTPNFYEQMHYLFAKGIIFKEATPDIALQVNGRIPRNTGFVFDFRILGQLSCLYLILLYYLNKKNSYMDVALLSVIAILTFSRGPILILLLLFIAIYMPKRIKVKKSLLLPVMALFVLVAIGGVFMFKNGSIQKFTQTFNPLAKNNAISQRGIFLNYALRKFYENPLGHGIGSLSSPKADVKIFAGYTNLHKETPDKVFYYKVGDAYLALSLAEKGIIGFVLLLLSFSEVFYARKNRISLFFLIGFYINLIGTDIPKQGFYYLALLLIYYGLSRHKHLNRTEYAGIG